jgi:EpsI family protein
MIVSLALIMEQVQERNEIIPERDSFTSFPSKVGDWYGNEENLDQIYLQALNMSDYALYDYNNKNGEIINFYAVYYASQRSGTSTHSPRTCIPGGGWKLTKINNQLLDGINIYNKPLSVNRVVIKRGDSKQLVYYWFQGRGRVTTNEYLVKWYLLVDSLLSGRTDGSLVRITTPITESESESQADQRLYNYIKKLAPELERFIPS